MTETTAKSRLTVMLITACLALLLTLNHVLFLTKIGNNIVHQDWWRFVHLVEDYHNGSLDFATLISPTNHHSIAVPAVFLIDGVMFDLDLRSVLLLPIPLLLLACWAVSREYRRLLPEHVLDTWKHGLLVVPLVILLIPLYYAWLFMCGPSVFNMVRVASYCISFVYFSSVLRKEHVGLRDHLISIAAVFFLIDVVGQGSSVLFGMTILLTMGFAIVVEKKYRSHSLYAIVTAIAIVLAIIIFAKLTRQTSRGMGENLAYVIEHPAYALEYVLLSAHTSLFGVVLSEHTAWQLSIGAIVLALYGFATVKLIQNRLWKQSYVPVMLLIMPWAFIALTMISRLVVFGDHIRSPIRYIADTNLGILGIYTILSATCWKLSSATNANPSTPERHFQMKGWLVGRFHVAMLAGLIGLVITSQSVSFQKQWVISDRLENKFSSLRKKMEIANRRELDTRQFSRMLNIRTHLVDKYARDALETMHSRQLSLFENVDSAVPPPRVARKRKRRSRKQ